MLKRFTMTAAVAMASPVCAEDRPTQYPTNAEMTAIFEADQAPRKGGKIDWSVVGPADEARRARTQALLDGGQLNSGDDYLHAAFVFQHGGQPEDYLKAHTLAVIAVARGKAEATWIAAATLDRYLMSIDKPQIYGTQFIKPEGGKTTQEPYRRDLLSDTLRQASRVPTMAEQEKRREELDRLAP